RALQGQLVAPVGQAELALGLAADLVAVVAVDAAGRDATHLRQVGAGRVAGLDGRGVAGGADAGPVGVLAQQRPGAGAGVEVAEVPARRRPRVAARSEEHTSELQSRFDLVCRLLLEKKK